MVWRLKALVIGSVFAIITGAVLGFLSGSLGYILGFATIIAGLAGGYGIKLASTVHQREGAPRFLLFSCAIIGILAFLSMYAFIVSEDLTKIAREYPKVSEVGASNPLVVAFKLIEHPQVFYNILSGSEFTVGELFFVERGGTYDIPESFFEDENDSSFTYFFLVMQYSFGLFDLVFLAIAIYGVYQIAFSVTPSVALINIKREKHDKPKNKKVV